MMTTTRLKNALLLASLAFPSIALASHPSSQSASANSPVGFISKTDRNFQALSSVLLEMEDGYLYRLPERTGSDFKDLYWLNLADGLYDRLSLERLGDVVLMSEGRFAVLHITSENVPNISGLLHDERSNCGHLMKLEGDVVVTNRAITPAVPIVPINEPIASLSSLHDQVSPESIRELVEEMSSLTTRYANASIAKKTTDLLVERYSRHDRPDITVKTFPHKSVPNQPSVIVRIEGTTRPEEVLVIGSHIDSIAMFSSSAPGADDNASGTASHFEVFRVILENNLHFDRTIEIHGYAAEELGLVGSQEIAKAYAGKGVKVVAMLQNDMNMYRAGDEDVIWLITNDTDSKLTKDLASLAAQYQTVAVYQGRLSAGSSDHRAWTRQGFPAAFPTENPNAFNRAIHTSRDTIESSGFFTQSAEFSKLTLSFLAHFAGLQHN